MKNQKTSSNRKIKKQPKGLKQTYEKTLFLLLVIVLPSCLYLQVCFFEYTFDDDVYIRKNTVVQKGITPHSLSLIFSKGSTYGFDQQSTGTYRPLTLLSFAFEKQLFGFSPQISHTLNLALYILSLIILFFLLSHLLAGYPLWLSFIITLLFALHPIHTEVVASIKSRDELLCFLFSVGSLIYLTKSDTRSLLLGSFAFACACLSKETALTFLLIIPIVLYIFKTYSIKQIAKTMIPVVGIAFCYLSLRVFILDAPIEITHPYINNSLLAAQSSTQYIASAIYILGEYLQLLFIPHTLSYDYSFNQIPLVTWTNLQTILSTAVYLFLIGYAIRYWQTHKVIVFGILFFFITLSISSNIFVSIASTMAERFLFFPSLGFCIALGGLFYGAKRRLNLKSHLPLTIAMVGILSVYGAQTYNRSQVWQNNTSLFSSGVLSSPNSFRTHFNLAEHLRTQAESQPPSPSTPAQLQTAAKHYRKSLEIYPHNVEGWYNLGVCEYSLNRIDQAETAYQQALIADSTYSMAANNLGVIAFNKQQFPDALRYFAQAVRHNPQYSDALANIGAIYQNTARPSEAIPYYEQALAIKPSPNIIQNLITVSQQIGDLDRVNKYRQALNQ